MTNPGEFQEEGQALESTLTSYQELLEPKSIHGDEGFLTIDEKSYLVDEVPQTQLVDPRSFLPLSSDFLVPTITEQLGGQVGRLIQEEEIQIQKIQATIDAWEKRISHHNQIINRNEQTIKQNQIAVIKDKKNRDYWTSRTEEVLLDFANTNSSQREEEWNWFIKKYGLKNADGTYLNAANPAIEELANGGAEDLAMQYRLSANKYEQLRKEREKENQRLINENAHMKNTNDTLSLYMQAAYADRIKPLEAGVLLFKELQDKLAEFKGQKIVTYSHLRKWAEECINDFLKKHPLTPASVVTDFRKIASIPLPGENS